MAEDSSCDPVVVVFRKWPDRSVLALFPKIPSDVHGFLCLSYEHLGQHAGADYTGCVSKTRPATESEYAPLKRELEGIGYNLVVRRRS